MNRAPAAVETADASPVTELGSNDLADPADTPAISVIEVIAGVHRVTMGTITVGYVQYTGDRFVSLLGTVYNTSVEVSQTLTLDSAVRRLLLA